MIAANGLVQFNAAGQPVLAQYRFATFGGTDKIMIAGGSPVTAPSAYGKVGAGIVIESLGGGTLSAPGSYLVVGYAGNAEGTFSELGERLDQPAREEDEDAHARNGQDRIEGERVGQGSRERLGFLQGRELLGHAELSYTPKGKHKAVTAGSVRYTISAGKTKILSVSLSKAAKAALKSGKGKLKVTATATATAARAGPPR